MGTLQRETSHGAEQLQKFPSLPALPIQFAVPVVAGGTGAHGKYGSTRTV